MKYTNVLDENLWPFISKYCKNKLYMFQEDNASYYASRMFKTKKGNNIPTLSWPDQSPDIDLIRNIRLLLNKIKWNNIWHWNRWWSERSTSVCLAINSFNVCTFKTSIPQLLVDYSYLSDRRAILRNFRTNQNSAECYVGFLFNWFVYNKNLKKQTPIYSFLSPRCMRHVLLNKTMFNGVRSEYDYWHLN